MPTISDAITDDHWELEQYHNEIVNNPHDHDHQQRYGNQFVWELARHSVGEELVVYPAMQKYLGARGKGLADHDRKEHHRVKEMLKDFQKMNAADEGYVPKLREIWASLKEHIREEEEKDLPELESKIRHTENESQSLARSFERTKRFVPSRSHPSAGERPPFETAMGLLTAPIDHVGDIFRKFPN